MVAALTDAFDVRELEYGNAVWFDWVAADTETPASASAGDLVVDLADVWRRTSAV